MLDLEQLELDYMNTLRKQQNIIKTIRGLTKAYERLDKELELIDLKRHKEYQDKYMKDVFDMFDYIDAKERI